MKNAGGATYEHRKLAGQVRQLGLEHLRTILDPKYKDKKFQKAMILKIGPALLPRLNEHAGEGGGPIKQTVTVMKYAKRNTTAPPIRT